MPSHHSKDEGEKGLGYFISGTRSAKKGKGSVFY